RAQHQGKQSHHSRSFKGWNPAPDRLYSRAKEEYASILRSEPTLADHRRSRMLLWNRFRAGCWGINPDKWALRVDLQRVVIRVANGKDVRDPGIGFRRERESVRHFADVSDLQHHVRSDLPLNVQVEVLCIRIAKIGIDHERLNRIGKDRV